MTRVLTKYKTIHKVDNTEEAITYSIILTDSSEPSNAFTFTYVSCDSWNYAFDNLIKAVKPVVLKYVTLNVDSVVLDGEV